MLVVDDDDVDRERLTRMLHRYGGQIEIEQVASKTGALRELRDPRKPYSFIFLDFKLGDGDGRDLLPDIWETVGAGCVVIAVTGGGSERVAAEAIKLGIHDYLSKVDLSPERVASAVDEGLRWLDMNQKMRQAEEELLHRSLHDPLTDLPNRQVFFDRLEHQCALFRRDKMPFAVLMLDLDRFKQVNDQLGHLAGDRVLAEMAHRMRASVREVDTVARLGGDEFALLLPGVATLNVALATAQKLVARLEQPVSLGGEVVTIGASIGIAVCPQHGGDPHTLVNRADNAMYRAKRNLDKALLYDSMEPSSANILDRLVLQGEVELALERREIHWFWQPKVDLRTREVLGFEALARWRHAQHGPIATDVFIRAIEESKLMWAFTLATVERVIEQLSKLPPEYGHLSVSVNVSAKVLQHEGFVDALLSRLQAAGVAPSRLALELTETALISNPVQAKVVLDQLARHGILLSIDDFGAGFTSFGYLRDFDVGEIKIDKSYVLHLPERPFDQSFVSCMAVFCRAQGLRLVAEGVENDQTWQLLTALGCEHGQGYGIARPMPFEQVTGWLQGW